MSYVVKHIEVCKGEDIGSSILEETTNIELYDDDMIVLLQDVIKFANEI